MNGIAKLLIRAYRAFISPLLGARCRFYPSCSEYAYMAFERHPWWKAAMLSAKRLSKCHPWHPGGVDYEI